MSERGGWAENEFRDVAKFTLGSCQRTLLGGSEFSEKNEARNSVKISLVLLENKFWAEVCFPKKIRLEMDFGICLDVLGICRRTLFVGFFSKKKGGSEFRCCAWVMLEFCGRTH